MNKEKALGFHCTLEATQAIIGGKHKSIIIHHLHEAGVLRYSELQKKLPYVTPKMLSQQLKDMIDDGIITRKLYPVVPPKTEYSLTELGETIFPIIEAMCNWGEEYFRRLGLPSPRCRSEAGGKSMR